MLAASATPWADVLQSQAGGSTVSIAVMVVAYAFTYRAIVRSGCTAHPGWLVQAVSRVLGLVGAVITGGDWWGIAVIAVTAGGNAVIGLTGVPAWRRNGHRLDRLDQTLLAVACVSVVVSLASTAMVLVVASAASGVASTTPTIRKAFQDPARESLWGWAPFAVSAALTLAVVPWEWGTGLMLAISGLTCLAVMVASFAGRVLGSHHQRLVEEPVAALTG